MDNNQNFNQQQPQNNVFQQQPQNGAQQPNNMFQQQFQQPKQPSNMNMNELISIILSGVGFLMVFLGTIFTCSCSATKFVEEGEFGLSAIFILTIFGIIACAAGVVLAIMALKQKDAAVKADKLAKIAAVVGVAGVVFGLLPLITMCGYNCSLNSEMESAVEDALGSLSDWF